MLLHCKAFNVLHTIISILFFTSPYNLFVFQLMATNDVWFLSLSLSLSIGNLLFSKIWWWFYDIKYALLVFVFNLVFLNRYIYIYIYIFFFVFHFSFDALDVRMSVSLELLHFMRKILFIEFKQNIICLIF